MNTIFVLASLCLATSLMMVSGKKLRFQKSNSRKIVEVIVSIKTEKPINEVEPYFLSYCMDSYVFDNDVRWLKFNFSSVKLETLLSGLSPAYFRVGGYPADYLFFDVPYDVVKATEVSKAAVVMTRDDVHNLIQITRKIKARLIFDLNLQVRFNKRWDPTNAIKLMEFLKENKYGENIDWELGNEPNYWAPGVTTPAQIADDFRSLHSLIKEYPLMKRSVVVGPDIITVDRTELVYLQTLANKSGDILRAVTFHHYYLRGDKATYLEYLDPKHFQNYDDVISMVKETLLNTSHPNLPIWNGETSDAWNGGSPNISDRYVSGFLWLDKLGLSAKRGINVVTRQTIYGHYYPLLDIDMNPNPDYWLSYIHKKLVGTRVFDLIHNDADITTRFYAHCTRPSGTYKAGSVTVFGFNSNPNKALSLKFAGPFENLQRDVYYIQPDDENINYNEYLGYYDFLNAPVLAKYSLLNGERLSMPSDTKMPDMTPLSYSPSDEMPLLPYNFIFIVFPDAQIPSCL